MHPGRQEKKFIEKAISAIADPCRMQIVEEAFRQGEICCGDVQALTGLSQPTCSHHIRLLCESQLLECRKMGRNHFFSLNRASFSRVSVFFQQFQQEA